MSNTHCSHASNALLKSSKADGVSVEEYIVLNVRGGQLCANRHMRTTHKLDRKQLGINRAEGCRPGSELALGQPNTDELTHRVRLWRCCDGARDRASAS